VAEVAPKFVPKAIVKLVADIDKNLGFQPTLTRVGDRRIRITIDHPSQPRVFCTVDYKFTGNRWEWANSKLVVDGNRIAIMESPQAFYRLFHDPDSLGMKAADLSILDKLAPIEPDSTLALHTRGLAEFIQAKVRRIDPNTQIDVKVYRGNAALLVTMARAHILWVIDPKHGGIALRLFALDGWDFTIRFKDLSKLAEMFGFLAESHGVDPSLITRETTAPPTQFTSAPQSVSNAVRTRKQTVIRT